jgi:hypothetical protein
MTPAAAEAWLDPMGTRLLAEERRKGNCNERVLRATASRAPVLHKGQRRRLRRRTSPGAAGEGETGSDHIGVVGAGTAESL